MLVALIAALGVLVIFGGLLCWILFFPPEIGPDIED